MRRRTELSLKQLWAPSSKSARISTGPALFQVSGIVKDIHGPGRRSSLVVAANQLGTEARPGGLFTSFSYIADAFRLQEYEFKSTYKQVRKSCQQTLSLCGCSQRPPSTRYASVGLEREQIVITARFSMRNQSKLRSEFSDDCSTLPNTKSSRTRRLGLPSKGCGSYAVTRMISGLFCLGTTLKMCG